MNDLEPRKRQYRIWLMILPRRHALLLPSLGLALLALVATLAILRHSDAPGFLLPEGSPLAKEEAPVFDDRFADAVVPMVRAPAAPRRDVSREISERFRLVMISTSTDASGVERSSAVIEERQSHRQSRYRKGMELEPSVIVEEILTNSVAIGTAYGRVLLTIGGAAPDGRGGAASAAPSAVGFDSVSNLAKFGGRKVDTNTWEFSRSALTRYYDELSARPERLVAVFDSLEPVYNPDRTIEGYRLNVVGEADFFHAVGLQAGDMVMSVNGIRMTNRYRAENLIRRFKDNDLDFVVMEVVRDGVTTKLYYNTVE